LQALGNGVGEFIALSVLMTIQLHLSVKSGVWLVGFIVMVMAACVVMMIREPVLKSKKQTYADNT